MRRGGLAVPAVLLVLLLSPHSADAQPGAEPARNTHARAAGGRDTTLSLGNARLFVPAGAVAPGSVVALGVGGVPAPGDHAGTTAIVVSAAGGLRAPVAALVALTVADRAATTGATPGLVDTATGTGRPCLDAGAWLACVVARPGAYVVGAVAAPPPDDPLLDRALADLPAGRPPARRPIALAIALVAGAAVAGAAVALLMGGPRDSQRRQV